MGRFALAHGTLENAVPSRMVTIASGSVPRAMRRAYRERHRCHPASLGLEEAGPDQSEARREIARLIRLGTIRVRPMPGDPNRVRIADARRRGPD